MLEAKMINSKSFWLARGIHRLYECIQPVHWHLYGDITIKLNQNSLNLKKYIQELCWSSQQLLRRGKHTKETKRGVFFGCLFFNLVIVQAGSHFSWFMKFDLIFNSLFSGVFKKYDLMRGGGKNRRNTGQQLSTVYYCYRIGF